MIQGDIGLATTTFWKPKLLLYIVNQNKRFSYGGIDDIFYLLGRCISRCNSICALSLLMITIIYSHVGYLEFVEQLDIERNVVFRTTINKRVIISKHPNFFCQQRKNSLFCSSFQQNNLASKK